MKTRNCPRTFGALRNCSLDHWRKLNRCFWWCWRLGENLKADLDKSKLRHRKRVYIGANDSSRHSHPVICSFITTFLKLSFWTHTHTHTHTHVLEHSIRSPWTICGYSFREVLSVSISVMLWTVSCRSSLLSYPSSYHSCLTPLRTQPSWRHLPCYLVSFS